MTNEILTDITDFCSECPKHESCLEEECILFRIEQRLVKLDKYITRLEESINNAQDMIREESSLNDAEIDELAKILDSYRGEE